MTSAIPGRNKLTRILVTRHQKIYKILYFAALFSVRRGNLSSIKLTFSPLRVAASCNFLLEDINLQ